MSKAELQVDENNVAKCNQKDADAGMSYAIIACNVKEAEKSDTELNKVYSRLIVNIKKENDHLKVTQRAWIKYIDTQCTYDKDGGSSESLRVNSCIDKMTVKRVLELKEATCTEVEFTSPCYLTK